MSEEKRQKKIFKFNISCQNKKRMINAFNNQGIHIKHKDTNLLKITNLTTNYLSTFVSYGKSTNALESHNLCLSQLK